MNEIEKCPLCGKVPGWHDFDIEARIFGGERSYFCCGMKASTAVLWNQYAAAMELALELVKLEKCSATDPEYHKLEYSIAQMEHHIIQVFGTE